MQRGKVCGPLLSILFIQFLEEGAAEAMGKLISEISAAIHRPLCLLPRLFQKRQVLHNIRRLQVRHAMLVVTEKFAGAPKEEILFGKEEAVLDFTHQFHAEPCDFILVVGIEDAVGLGAAPSYPSPKLMELGKAEPVRPIDEHDGGIGHIHPTSMTDVATRRLIFPSWKSVMTRSFPHSSCGRAPGPPETWETPFPSAVHTPPPQRPDPASRSFPPAGTPHTPDGRRSFPFP